LNSGHVLQLTCGPCHLLVTANSVKVEGRFWYRKRRISRFEGEGKTILDLVLTFRGKLLASMRVQGNLGKDSQPLGKKEETEK